MRLTFPEFTDHVRTLESELATVLLSRYPTARAFRAGRTKGLARVCFDGHRYVGERLALITAAKDLVGRHYSGPYQLEIKYLTSRCRVERLRNLERDIESMLDEHRVAKLLTTIDGIGRQTAARLVAELGAPARFRSSAALASYVG